MREARVTEQMCAALQRERDLETLIANGGALDLLCAIDTEEPFCQDAHPLR